MVTLNGITINVSEDVPQEKPLIIRNKIAGSARTRNTNLGPGNGVWNLQGWVKTEAAEKALRALSSLSTMVFVDKYSDSWDVQMTLFAPTRKNHDKVNYSMTLEEVE